MQQSPSRPGLLDTAPLAPPHRPPSHPAREAGRRTSPNPDYHRAIECTEFPFEHLSGIAELESWRKEINRPIYHLHKWWAQRLGSVFRAILIGCFARADQDVLDLFYRPSRLHEVVVFDPFMGSGTTIGEALKLGARVIGRDINPVAHFIVRNALRPHRRTEVMQTFEAIEQDVAPSIRHFYTARLSDDQLADVLYYFWVKAIPCPQCQHRVDIFPSYVFAHHAYPTRHPDARALCPHCGAINTVRSDAPTAVCSACHRDFAPQSGPASRSTARCPNCRHTFSLARTVKASGAPPDHRLYAKLILTLDGRTDYVSITDHDRALYAEAASLLQHRPNPYPLDPITPDSNTNQVLNYCYKHWHQMFNDRQLLCSSILAERIRAIPREYLRDLFLCLFTGTLEFNNMFSTYKGEGTGAVLHMFSHHILKPEKTPLEANLWGTARSSGSFSTLFKGRLLRALDYCADPFEIARAPVGSKHRSTKIYGLSSPVIAASSQSYQDFLNGSYLYLSCGDSSRTELLDQSVDVVVTDPPFFDNVQYSQLADFFYVWQRHVLDGSPAGRAATTRSLDEVQQTDPAVFTERLAAVWRECLRVLRPEGLLVFTYHHSRSEGWRCLLEATMRSGFFIVAAHPVKAEMSVAAPKHQASEPIDLDVIVVCRKRAGVSDEDEASLPLVSATQTASEQVARLTRTGRRLSRGDRRIVVTAQLIRLLSTGRDVVEALRRFDQLQGDIETASDQLHNQEQSVAVGPADAAAPVEAVRPALF